ncbi:maleylacetoacetate isomerase [Ralstonia flatus]|jgi:maleylacetoacetate isomerase|uniref:Maleylpyruvate isomerase n=1 Tax=Ralstonia flatus TaxID=3058601 RepID=A0ABN9KIE6_9RALS|nr:maleylacetoacetate isomerase [Ralstonia sp. LMG 32965]CAJ0896265.1 Maleylpyruvate isomerase [Ralstonia sp. LMG 32965]
MQLYSFFNSSTSYRVRIALTLKGLPYDYLAVNIRTGEHRTTEYVQHVSPSAAVPALVDGALQVSQSLAIIDYLDVVYPEPRLIPLDPVQRARVLELSNAIACDIHPINNLRVLRYLQDVLKVTPEQKEAWYRHWIHEGMTAVERLLVLHGHGTWCFGDSPTLADVALVPQIANALRMGCQMDRFERAMAVHAFASAHPAFAQAAPMQQPDYTS